MQQHLFTQPGFVLDAHGRPNPGYSTRPMLTYRRGDIHASPFRIKEWDFYQVSNQQLCLQFTFGHASYAGEVGIMLFDFRKGEWIERFDHMLALPFSSLHMPADADADQTLTFDKDGVFMEYQVQSGVRTLRCAKDDFEAKITLTRENPEAVLINIPFAEKPTQFYYNHKINCMRAEGWARKGGKTYTFSPADSFGLLDWGRGVWPFHNEWFWSNGTGEIDGSVFGFNLGCGFGDTSRATENMLFYAGKAHKLGRVSITHEADWMQPWRLQDDAGRISLTLTPTYDRTTKTKILFIDNVCHQVFGRFDGFAVLDDGTRLAVNELYAFAEHAVNNW
ncbi:MAG: DUF2804 domain-containing protein [Faecalibacterium sp.]|jgi:hypothetical protein|nr:DUF2804 domain-containing protein [Faecalibacterium sp.]